MGINHGQESSISNSVEQHQGLVPSLQFLDSRKGDPLLHHQQQHHQRALTSGQGAPLENASHHTASQRPSHLARPAHQNTSQLTTTAMALAENQSLLQTQILDEYKSRRGDDIESLNTGLLQPESTRILNRDSRLDRDHHDNDGDQHLLMQDENYRRALNPFFSVIKTQNQLIKQS